MESNTTDHSENVRRASIRLLHEIKFESNLSSEYALPYANYIMSWAEHLPIHTIIIGQNPYPQKIYPLYGAAFAYDEAKCGEIPPTVSVIAEDLYNYNKTSKDTTINCFKDSWRLLELGIILINETIFDKLSTDKRNTRGIKEMEAQLRLLQIVISESYSMGVETIDWIGMGIPAAEMTSIARAWCPKDLIRMRTVTCKNPAAIARNIGDLPSHQITIDKPAASKLLSRVVHLYSTMPQQKSSQIDKRREQNAKALKKASDEVTATADMYSTEIQSFEDRLRQAHGEKATKATLEQLADSIGSMKKALESHRNAVSSHSITMLMLVESMPKNQSGSNDHRQDLQSSQQQDSPRPPRGPRRRGTPLKTAPSDDIQSISEIGEPILATPVTTSVSRARRRGPRSVSYAPSNVDSEYTVASAVDTSPYHDLKKDMSATESINMKSFANWCNENLKGDPTYAEMLNSAAEEMSTSNDLSRSVLSYIKERKKEDPEFDAYDELTNPDSLSSVWASTNIIPPN